MRSLLILFTSIVAIAGLQGCLQKKGNEHSSYFPIVTVLESEQKLLSSQPYTLYRIVRMGNKIDSTIIPVKDVDWASIREVIANADISDAKYEGQYDVNNFLDPVSGDRVVTYTAKTSDLFTKSIMLTMDPVGSTVHSLYVRAGSGSYWKSRLQQITLIPNSRIQILDEARAKPGGARSLSVEFRLLHEQ